MNIVYVRSSSTADRVGAKKQANVVAGNVAYIVEYLAPGAFNNNVAAPDNYRDADDTKEDEYFEEPFHCLLMAIG